MVNFFQNLIGKTLPDNYNLFPEIPKSQPPKQIESLLEQSKKPENVKKIEETKNFFADVLRSFPRGFAQLGVKATQKLAPDLEIGAYIPDSKVERFIFGNEPITSPEKTGEKMLTGFGVSKEKAMKYGGLLGYPLAFSDIIPFGFGKKKVSEEILKKLITEFGEDVAEQIVKKGGKELAEKSLIQGGKELLEKEGIKIAEKVAIEIAPGTKALKITEEAIKNIEAVRHELEIIKGSPLTHIEVEEAAKTSDLLRRITTRSETLKREAQIQATKKHLAALAEKPEITIEFIDSVKTISSEATNLGRQLESLKIDAIPELYSAKIKMIQKLSDLGIEAEKIVEASKGIDWNNANDVAKFYRQFIKPTFGEWLDEYRYINLLSSPRTPIVNVFSNILQGVITAPVTKLYSGVIDLVGSSLTGKARENYLTEVPIYYKGMISKIGEAVSKSFDVLRGKEQIYRPDIARIPTKSKLLAPFQFIPRILEAGDVLLRTMIKGGEMESLALKSIKQGKELTPVLLAKLEKEAAEKAEYYVFRKALDVSNKTGQGYLLSKIDEFTSIIYKMRNIPLVKWFVPFVATPMNILKQGIEYSPLGLTTLAKNSNKIEQLAKTMVGSSVFLGAGYIAMKDGSTWAVPTDQKEKALFYASGKQPYSIKIGGYWISYSKLGPLAYPIAMASAIKYYTQENPKTINASMLEKTGKIMAGIGQFFSDQSYVQGIGNLVDAVQGDEYAIGQALANFPSQVIPLSSLQRWVTQIIDPIYRKPEKGISIEAVVENLKKGIPGLSQGLPAYEAPFGEESKRQFPLTNALSPFGITIENDEMNEFYNLLKEKKIMNSELQKMKEDLRKELGL